MGKLDGKVAAITGAGGGIGSALARAMAKQGASIVANDLGTTLAGDRAPTSPANKVVAEIKAAGGKAVANLMDISTRERHLKLGKTEVGGAPAQRAVSAQFS